MVKQVWGLNPNWFLHFNMTWSSGQLELNTSNCTTVNVKYSISYVRNNDEAMASRHDQYWYFICVFIEHSLFLIKYQRQVSPIFTMTRITLQHRLTGLQLRLREILNKKKSVKFQWTDKCFGERKKIFVITNPQKLDDSTLIFLLSGEVVPLPPQTILFFVNLYELE